MFDGNSKTMGAAHDTGRRSGEKHPKAVLTDHEVGLLLQLREEGFSLAWLAETFEVAKSTVFSIVSGRTRVAAAEAYRRGKSRE